MNVPPMIYMSSGRVTIAIHWPEDGKCWDELTSDDHEFIRDHIYAVEDHLNLAIRRDDPQ